MDSKLIKCSHVCSDGLDAFGGFSSSWVVEQSSAEFFGSSIAGFSSWKSCKGDAVIPADIVDLVMHSEKCVGHFLQDVETEFCAMAQMCCEALKDGLQTLGKAPKDQDLRTAFHTSIGFVRLIIHGLKCAIPPPNHPPPPPPHPP